MTRMISIGMPAAAAAVQPPIRKEWPLIFSPRPKIFATRFTAEFTAPDDIGDTFRYGIIEANKQRLVTLNRLANRETELLEILNQQSTNNRQGHETPHVGSIRINRPLAS